MTFAVKHRLAFNLDRKPIYLPYMAVAWRVSFVPRGSLEEKRGDAPELVASRAGTPLYLSVKDSREALALEVSRHGPYRLDTVTRSLRVLPGAEPVYVEIPSTVTCTGWEVGAVMLGSAIIRAVSNAYVPPPPLPRPQGADKCRGTEVVDVRS